MIILYTATSAYQDSFIPQSIKSWITNKKFLILARYSIQNEITTCTKYLGVIIDQNLKWLEHVKQITDKANRVHGFLICDATSICSCTCPMSAKINCYKTLVKPVLDYAATV